MQHDRNDTAGRSAGRRVFRAGKLILREKWNERDQDRIWSGEWLRLDAWLDSSLYEFYTALRNLYSDYSSFFGRFHVTGYKKVLAELFSEGATLVTAGFGLMLALALPAFELTDKDWRSAGEYSVTFLDRYGNEIGKRGDFRDESVPLEEIPDVMVKAALATEDRRFYEHFGIDIIGLTRAIAANLQGGGGLQGGSSITQQLAKNLFLTPEQTLERKIKEAFLSFWLEARLTKDEILKLYFDRAYMGGGAFGVEAASQFYFGKSVRDINLSEAAMLAGLFKAPSKYAPHRNLAASRLRANEVLDNMVEAGFLTEGQVHGARLNPARIIQREDTDIPNYFLDWAFEETKRLVEGGEDYVLTVQTTVDMNLQKAADQAVTTILRQYGRSKNVRQAAMVAMEHDGAVRVIVGGRDYDLKDGGQFNRATKSLRQPGSSFKPYVYITALENGYTPNSRVVDSPVSCRNGSRYWSPRNYNGRYRGSMPMWYAVAKSINTVPVKLSLSIGRDKVLANLKKLGLGHIRKSCSMALGDQGVTILQHTAAYAVFANGGMEVKPYGILEIRNNAGTLIYSRERDEPPPKRLFKRKHAEQMNYMLGQVTTQGTARRAQLDFTTTAGKTGTTSGYKDAWFLGYTGQYVAGVWYGNDNFTPTGRVTGGSLPAMTWHAFMTYAHASMNIPQIPGLPLHKRQIEEMQRIAQARALNKSLGHFVSADARSMSKQSRKVLRGIAKILRSAPPIPAGRGTKDRAALGTREAPSPRTIRR